MDVEDLMDIVYKCKVCSSEFNCKKELVNHISDVHSNGTSHEQNLVVKKENETRSPTSLKTISVEITKFNIWQCTECNETFKLKVLLQNHWRKKHQKPKKKCPKCPVKCASSEELEAHIHCHYMSTFKCVMCDYTNPHWHRVKIHLETHNKTNKFSCNECSKTFACSATLSYHKRFHHFGGFHLCDECGYSARSKYWLVQHQMKEHTNQVVCDMCGHRCDNPIDMATHKRERHDNLFLCKSCPGSNSRMPGLEPAKFRSKEELLRHMEEAHPGEKCFFCEKCNYVAKLRQHLTKHTYMHTGERPYKCDHPGCGFETRDHRNLKQHKVTKHRKPGELVCRQCRFVTTNQNEWDIHRAMFHMKIFTCKECDFQSPNSASVRRHRLAKHVSKEEMRYPCQHCNYRTNLKESLHKHMLTHVIRESTFNCILCEETLVDREDTERHLTEKHCAESVHLCPHCAYMTAKLQFFQKHLKKHVPDKDKPFACELCHYKGRTKILLKSHMTNKHRKTSEANVETAATEKPASASAPYPPAAIQPLNAALTVVSDRGAQQFERQHVAMTTGFNL